MFSMVVDKLKKEEEEKRLKEWEKARAPLLKNSYYSKFLFALT
jgi:hypothetical protein